MAEDYHVTVEDYQAEWLEQEGLSPSRLLQDAIDRRMDEYGFDPESWAGTYNE